MTESKILPALPTKRNFASCAPAQPAFAAPVYRHVGLEAATPSIVNCRPEVFFAIPAR